MGENDPLQINSTTYQWCVRAFTFLKNRLGINILVHDGGDTLDQGQIFVFNHFARFETIIPQYILYQGTGAYCRCVAASEIFQASDRFARFLKSIGAVPNDLSGLLAFLAAETLRGRKIIVFPEGGMIKDRRVVDDKGRYRILSPSTNTWRKHHKGAAAIALTLELFKKRILSVHARGETERLQRWVNAVGLETIDVLVEAARQPTVIVPANITFYPIRTEENILSKGAELLGVDAGPVMQEELLIEGNILLKRTDMDIRFGHPIEPKLSWPIWERVLLNQLFARINSLEDLFALQDVADTWLDRIIVTAMGRETRRMRDSYMREIYALTTINLSHVTSHLIMDLLDQGVVEIPHEQFHRQIYLSIKRLLDAPGCHLHRSLTNPERYDGIHVGGCAGFDQLLETAVGADLIEVLPDGYRFLPKLRHEHELHEVRLENPLSVYANEVAPVPAARKAIAKAIKAERRTSPDALAHQLFDDEIRAWRWCKSRYRKPRHAEINDQETATESGKPFLLIPKRAEKPGVVLVHGLLASPAEMADFGRELADRGHPVIGVRLKGHGTSPWDLRDRTWMDWLSSVRRGFEILSAFCERTVFIGFSTGGTLALHLASERPAGLAGVAAVAAPLKFRNRNLVFVPLLDRLNRLTDWGESWNGIMAFRANESEHPHINYRNIPIRALYELLQLTGDLSDRLPEVTCPVTLIQGSDDQVVHPDSGAMILSKLGSVEKALHMIPSDRHGILNEDIGETRAHLHDFLDALEQSDPAEEIPFPRVMGNADAPPAA